MAFLQLIFDGQVKQEYEINKTEFTIGRSANNDVVIDNRSVSGKHAHILKKDDEYILQDLDSTNGTKVNGHKVKTVKLQHGDHIGLFKYTLCFNLIASNEADTESTISQSQNAVVNDDATVLLNSSQINNMMSDYKSDDDKQKARLEVTTADQIETIYIEDKPILIGKNSKCNIKTGGWFFTPSISAVIRKDLSGTYSIKPEATIKINDKKTKKKQLLKNNDHVLIRNVLIIFMLD